MDDCQCRGTEMDPERSLVSCQSGERRVVQAGTVGNINRRVSDWLINIANVTCFAGRFNISPVVLHLTRLLQDIKSIHPREDC